MRRSKITLEQILDINNCERGIINAGKNKAKRKKRERRRYQRTGQLRKTDILYIEAHSKEFAVILRQFLIDVLEGKAFFHQGDLATINNDGSHKKQRELCKPRFFPDQCAHWAIMQIVQPELEKGFDFYSCAAIKGRGTSWARKSVEHFMQDINEDLFCAQTDVKGFYRSIRKDKLVMLFTAKIKDKRIVILLAAIVYSYKLDGLPLGYYPSASFANFYLNELDHELRNRHLTKYLVRYADDIIMCSTDKTVLHQAIDFLNHWLITYRTLHLKCNWQVYKIAAAPHMNGRAIDFVGFRFYRTKTTIRRSIYNYMSRLYQRMNNGKYTLLRCYRYSSYNGYILVTNSDTIKQKYLFYKINAYKIKEVIRNESRKQSEFLNSTH